MNNYKYLVTLLKCLWYPKTNALLVCKNENGAIEVFRKTSGLISAKNYNSPKSILFKNGSKLDVIMPSTAEQDDCCRGRRSDVLVMIDSFNQDKLKGVQSHENKNISVDR